MNADVLAENLHELDQVIREGYSTRRRSRKKWGWIGASVGLLVSLLCGGITAAYFGWQLVNGGTLAVQRGSINTLASAPTSAPPQVYLIITATSEPPLTASPPATPVSSAQAISPEMGFPQAVTPTPDDSRSASSSDSQSGALTATDAESPPVTSPEIAAAGHDPAAPNMQLPVPTRRPTPILDIIANTPVPDQPSPTPTWTPTVALGTPVVIFAAQDSALTSGKCTMVTWHVENVVAVFYENLGVNGHGEQEECLRDSAGDYLLTVVLQDGSTKTYTTTVDLIEPTTTPTPTPTFTPEGEPTATWTPVAPTDTPTPERNYGAILDVDGGSHHTCSPGQTCDVGLLITNTGDTIDNLIIEVVQSGSWGQQLCRLDGVCSNSSLTMIAVGPSNTAYIQLVVRVPTDAPAHTSTYAVRALSEGSNETAGSDIIGIEMKVE